MRGLGGVAEALRIAIAAVRANPARGALTTLGIVIGIVAVVTTMTAANGLANSFRESASVLGTDVLYVSRTPWVMTGSFRRFRDRPSVTLRESEQLERLLRSAVAVNPTANTNRAVRYGSEVREGMTVIGTTDKHMLMSTAVPELGRFFTAMEVQYSRPVCVLGRTVREELFGDQDPLNQELRIGRFPYRVIGVMERQGSAGSFGGPDFDSQVFVPVSTFTRHFGGANRNFDLAVKAPPGVALADYEYEVTGAMRGVRGLTPTQEDDFSINKMESLLDAFDTVMRIVLLVGLAVTGVSLFVGGVGVMNIMLVSVTERTREIGIRKAIGARRSAVLLQFLLEAAAICLLGGAIGVTLSFAVAAAIDRFVMPASVSLPIVAVALAVSLATGIVSGLVPAWRASRLNPIEALRYE